MTRARHPLAAALLLALAALPAAQAQEEDIEALRQKAIRAAIEKVGPCVVTIETSGGTDIIVAGPRGRKILRGTGPTSGLIVGADGYVITSAFNFANKPSSIFVTVAGHKERYVAKKVATDQTRMLTLLKIDAKGLPVPRAAAEKDIRVGQTALAVGRTLEQDVEQPPSVSEGIVSAVHRIWGKAIQSDAKISPVNYGGPLIDLTGRVMGVMVPASPNAEGETAGYEWYDSGIGFAVPLEDINRVLPRMIKGETLKKAVLGVTMKNPDRYSVEPAVGTVSPGSSAEAIGLKPGDVIEAIDGKPVNNFAQLLHQLGGKYEGDEVSLKVRRDKETLTFEKVKLGGAVTAFGMPFLGILPMRDDPEPGLEVRYVFPKGPAEKAGIKAGDRITKAGPNERRLRPFSGRDQLANLLASARPGTKMTLEVMPKGAKEAKKLTVELGDMTEAVPAELPEKASKEKALEPRKPAGGAPAPRPGGEKKEEDKKDEKKEEKGKAPTGLLSRTTADRGHNYWVYVPDDYNPNISHALLIWLHPVGKNKERDMEGFVDHWSDYCSANHIILLMPKSENETGWVASEMEFIREAARSVQDNYTIDKRRVVAHGMGVGGQLAFYMGFAARDLVRGVATTGSVLASNPKERVPNQPLAFFIIAGEKDPIREAVKGSREKLTEHKYPIVYREMKGKGHEYFDFDTEDLKKEMVRWIDSLDRL